MFQRKLPTLQFDDYVHAAAELKLLTTEIAWRLLKVVGSNKSISEDTLLRSLPDNSQNFVILSDLCIKGYIIREMSAEISVTSTTSSVQHVYHLRVNWKQIRQLNKAISLL